MRITASLFATFALASCAMEDIVETEVAELGGAGCPSWGCPDNSPLMGPYYFWEGNTAGANDEGMTFKELVKAGIVYEPQIIGDQLLGYHRASNTYLRGAALTGSYFRVGTPSGPFELIISKVNVKAFSGVKFWIGKDDPIETYELRYKPEGSDWGAGETLCHNPPSRDAGEGNNRAWNAPLEAILFAGDRYDARARKVKDISREGTRGWFTIACAGSALAKLHLNRHTTAGSDATHVTTAAQRTALLKMYSSDICGTGTPYTNIGVPLRWSNQFLWSTLSGTDVLYEARWNDSGALCMDTHRLGTLYTTQFQAECAAVGHPLPPCSGSLALPTVFPSNTYIVTTLPGPV